MFKFLKYEFKNVENSLKLIHQLFFCNHKKEYDYFFIGTDFESKQFNGYCKYKCSKCGDISYTRGIN